MKRIITSLKNINKDVFNALQQEFPNGIDDAEFINFPTANGGFLKALELQLGDNLYLIKMDDEDYYQRFHSRDQEKDDDDEDEDEDEVLDELDDVDDVDDIDDESE